MPLNDPVPSTAFDVLQRNMQDDDLFTNSTENQLVNRVGDTIYTLTGMQFKFNSQYNANQLTFDNQIIAINNEANSVIDAYRATYIGDYVLPDKQFTAKGQFVMWATGDGGDGNAYVYIGPQSGLPYTTDVSTYPDPNNDPQLQVNPTVTPLYVQEQAHAGDSQVVGGIWPIDSQEGAVSGQSLTGYEHVRLIGGDFPVLTLFTPIYQNNPNDDLVGVITNINLTTAPYTADVGGLPVYLRIFKYSQKSVFTWREFGAKSGAAIDPTVNANAIQACIRTSYLSAVQSGFRLDTIKIKSGTGKFRVAPNILLTDNAAGTFNIEGAGYDKTTLSLVVASPVDTEFMFLNENEWAFTTFTGFTFETENDNGNLYKSTTTGTVQSLNFVECRFSRFNGGFWAGPSLQNSEYTFTRCKFNTLDNASYVFKMENQQAVNWRFYATDIQDFVDSGFLMLKGATIYFNQGSIIPAGNGRVIDIPLAADPASSGDNNPTFFFSGTRFEYRDDAQLFRKLNDDFYTHIVWEGCGMGGQNLGTQFPIQYGGNAVFTMNDCENLRNWKINFFSPGGGSRKSNWNIDNCSLPADFISSSTFSLSGSPNNVARLPLFDIKNNEQATGLNGVFRPQGGYLGAQEKRSQTFSFLQEDKKLAAGVATFEETLDIHPGRFTKVEFLNFAIGTYGATTATIKIYNDAKSQLIAERTYIADAFSHEVIYVDYILPPGDNLRFEFSNAFANQTINYTYWGEILITN